MEVKIKESTRKINNKDFIQISKYLFASKKEYYLNSKTNKIIYTELKEGNNSQLYIIYFMEEGFLYPITQLNHLFNFDKGDLKNILFNKFSTRFPSYKEEDKE